MIYVIMEMQEKTQNWQELGQRKGGLIYEAHFGREAPWFALNDL